MTLEIKQRAANTLAKIADWVEAQHTQGAGDRWLQNTMQELTEIASTRVRHAICKAPSLAKYDYRCFTYHSKWVVAYKIESGRFVVYRFIYGACYIWCMAKQ